MGPEVRANHAGRTCYDLLANIVHDGEPTKGTYRVHILHKATGKWFEMQDLHVTEILPQMITLTEAYIQVGEFFDQTYLLGRNAKLLLIFFIDLGDFQRITVNIYLFFF